MPNKKQLELFYRLSKIDSAFYESKFGITIKNNTAEVYVSGYDFFPALFATISKAKHHIHIVSYIIDDDPLGRLLRDTLIDKARKVLKLDFYSMM